MPPVLDPSLCRVDGLAFLGLSLTRRDSHLGHPDSTTHQTAFDFNVIQDRQYDYVASTNDDGWLVGGGEPLESYKLSAPDSAHVEIMRIGTFEPKWGGLSVSDIRQALESGAILIPEVTVCPTAVVANQDEPPELEVRFDMEPRHVLDPTDLSQPLPLNWELRFIHNQLFKHFHFPARFCPGAHHMTFVRKAEFKSDRYRAAYFQKCAQQVEQWKQQGPQPLVALSMDDSIERVSMKSTSIIEDRLLRERGDEDDWVEPIRDSGIFLFRDRNTITHYFPPNFYPPYDSPEKKAFILSVIADEWDEETLSWRSGKELEAIANSDIHRDDCGIASVPANPLAAIWKVVLEPKAAASIAKLGTSESSVKELGAVHEDEKGISGLGACGMQSLMEELLDPQPDPMYR